MALLVLTVLGPHCVYSRKGAESIFFHSWWPLNRHTIGNSLFESILFFSSLDISCFPKLALYFPISASLSKLVSASRMLFLPTSVLSPYRNHTIFSRSIQCYLFQEALPTYPNMLSPAQISQSRSVNRIRTHSALHCRHLWISFIFPLARKFPELFFSVTSVIPSK